MSILIAIAFIMMLFIGVPLFLVLSTLAFFLFWQAGSPPMVVINEMFSIIEQEIFITLPLFTFAGIMMSKTKLPERLLRLINSIFGWVPGGLAIVTIFVCSLITAFTGVTGVTIVAAGVLLYPALRADGYSDSFSLGLITTSGSLGLLLPPSIPLILFAVIAELDALELFKAGILPTILMLLALSVYCMINGAELRKEKQPFSLKQALAALWNFRWELPIFIFIPLGIFTGFMTAVEAASLLAFYVLVIDLFILKEIKFSDFPKVAREAMVMIGSIIIIIMASLATSNYFLQENIPFKLFAFLNQHISTKIGFLLSINVFLLVLGCMLDIFSSIMIIVPLLIPVAAMYEVNLYHLGIIFLANMQIGYVTPPLGMNLFISSKSFDKPVITLFKASIPFILILLLILLLITYIPTLSLVFLR
ncbi:MAG: TRAP transporter large permease subunit [Elusimicrobia bacterium]|nr:TRAP transporter large permease subunit [Elusimicrobiota bacterium]